GMQELTDLLAKHMKSGDWKSKRQSPTRLREEAKSLLRREWENQVATQLGKITDISSFQKILK
ncbi:hypothetical protein NQU49_27220, partial [Escherichia coli]|uniref:hypothetical protein n=1 Tax=Escherichia coli TaxID=562 RepID=UPI002117B265